MGAIRAIDDVLGLVIRIRAIDAVADHPFVRMFPDGPHLGVVIAEDGAALFLDLGDKLGKRLLDVFFAAVMVKMVILDVGDHGDVRPEFQE